MTNKYVEEAPYHPGYEDAVITNKMSTTKLIEALDNRYGNPNAKGLELIQEAIRVLRYQHEELEALMEKIK